VYDFLTPPAALVGSGRVAGLAVSATGAGAGLAGAAGIVMGSGASFGKLTGPGAEIENMDTGGGSRSVEVISGDGLDGLRADLSGGDNVRLGGSGVVARAPASWLRSASDTFCAVLDLDSGRAFGVVALAARLGEEAEMAGMLT
jgi:hypothetical protein